MPKGFNDNEKQIIRKALIDKGKLLFSTYGLKRTSIEDLTRAAGIAQGSFYAFYDSKEELYFEILEIEQDNIRDQLKREDIISDTNPKNSIKKLLLHSLDLIENNALIRQFYFENEMDTLIRKLPAEKLEAHINKDTDVLLPVIYKWQKDGIIIKKEPEVIAGVLRAIFVTSLHKKEIGESVYMKTIDLLIELIVDGLVV